MWNAFPANKEYLSQHTCLVSKKMKVFILLKIRYLQLFIWMMITWSQTGMMVDWSTLMNVSSATPRTRLTWKTRPDQMMFFISSVDHKNIRGGLTNQSSVLQYVNRDSRSTGWKVKSYFRDTLRKGEQDSIVCWCCRQVGAQTAFSMCTVDYQLWNQRVK